ncbi:YkyA family protein [Alkalihalobacillus sp. AL-G]|uniref:YkyA family protein n=1 Tax=Alkalihalobacillus sp. AL-G TaxID=2926399 RepID=UPI00272D6D11|nr:YkyA family protein [Alkalihalobacillus sp. AL-G]WLD94997.1 YkyA family protein [Alkalihalobacillus sp. AL-G]
MFIKKIAFVLVIFILLLSGCSFGPSAEEKIYEHLEKTVSLEAGFAEVQEPLVKAETEEQKIFSEILKLSMKELDKIKTLSDKAAELAQSRAELLEKEKDSIHSAYEEFISIEPLVKELEVKEIKDKADELVTTMNNRYDQYNELHNAYGKALEMDQGLYEMLKKEDLTLDKLKSYIDQLNQQYERVFDEQEKFNELTDRYNDQKQSFYKEAGFTTK